MLKVCRLLGVTLLAATLGALLSACGQSSTQPQTRSTSPIPPVVLTANDRQVWSMAPLAAAKIPVLVYHGIAPISGFSNSADAAYGIDPAEFIKQVTLLHLAGYHTISLDEFVRFVRGEQTRLPARPLLLTFDDARADSWIASDQILRKFHYNAIMFVDVGAVDRGEPEYLTWPELAKMQRSHRWDLQLHSGFGHHNVRYGPAPKDSGPFYAYRLAGEDIAGWRQRVYSDLELGQQQLSAHIPTYRAQAFAPPYGNFGQESTNDPLIPGELLIWLGQRFAVVFTQDRSGLDGRGQPEPLGRIQVTRHTSGGDLHASLANGGDVPGGGH